MSIEEVRRQILDLEEDPIWMECNQKRGGAMRTQTMPSSWNKEGSQWSHPELSDKYELIPNQLGSHIRKRRGIVQLAPITRYTLRNVNRQDYPNKTVNIEGIEYDEKKFTEAEIKILSSNRYAYIRMAYEKGMISPNELKSLLREITMGTIQIEDIDVTMLPITIPSTYANLLTHFQGGYFSALYLSRKYDICSFPNVNWSPTTDGGIFTNSAYQDNPEDYCDDYDIIYIPLMLPSHANMLLWFPKSNIVERFEPNGAAAYEKNIVEKEFDVEQLDKDVENFLHEIDNNIIYIPPIRYCPLFVFQLRFERDDGSFAGFCALWTLWYTEHRIKYQSLERSTLIEILMEKLHKIQQLDPSNGIKRYLQTYLLQVLEVANDWIVQNVGPDVAKKLWDLNKDMDMQWSMSGKEINEILRPVSEKIYQSYFPRHQKGGLLHKKFNKYKVNLSDADEINLTQQMLNSQKWKINPQYKTQMLRQTAKPSMNLSTVNVGRPNSIDSIVSLEPTKQSRPLVTNPYVTHPSIPIRHQNRKRTSRKRTSIRSQKYKRHKKSHPKKRSSRKSDHRRH